MLERKLLHAVGSMMAVQAKLSKGDVVNMHSHKEEQISYVVKGSLELIINGKKEVYNEGELFYIPSNIEHGVYVLEECEIIDVFNPIRQDILEQLQGNQ